MLEHSYLGQSGQFVTNRNYPKFAIQEMVVNSECHRDYSIKGTEIQIKMFDDRLVFESPGKLPGLVRAENIRHTHFSRNPKIAQFLKAYNYVKEFGEGIDRICNELESRGAIIPTFHTDAFILKATLKAEFVDEKTKVGGDTGDTDVPLNVPLNTKSLAECMGLGRKTMQRELNWLQEQGAIRWVGAKKNGHWEIVNDNPTDNGLQ